MNATRRVLILVLTSIGLYLALSASDLFFHWNWEPFRRINLLADLFEEPVSPPAPPQPVPVYQPPAGTDTLTTIARPAKDFMLYQRGHFITDFSTDTIQSSLNRFAGKLHQLHTTHKGKVRIAYFGDSMIEGDLLTQTLRKSLQQAFGGSGVGFVPVTSQVAHFRQTVSTYFSEGWKDENFKEGRNKRLYLSGHTFRTPNAWVQLTDQTIRDDSSILEKSLICGTYGKPMPINVNKQQISIQPDKPVNRIVLGKDARRSIGLGIANENLPVYGVSFESEDGIFVDNFSFRGITGIEFAGIDSAFLQAINDQNPYDLIVFQYGVNLLYRPQDKQFSWYADIMRPVIRKMKQCFPQSDFILVSTADRAFRYSGKYQSAIGIDSLVKTQAQLAFETGTSFYNQFATMGGSNSIIGWANAKPSLANQDLVHPNARGAEVLAKFFYDAILDDYHRYKRAIK